MRSLLIGLAGLFITQTTNAQDSFSFDAPDPETDRLVERCLETEGVNMLEDSDVICYNSAIFPEQFLKLNGLPEASRIIITSPGGNVATARGMSTILDNRGEPAVIAGQCMSACAMVILPGLDEVHIHHTAHIAVHGITMMKFRQWWGWLKEDATPPPMALMAAQLGYDFGYILHHSGADHMRDHLEGQKVDLGYIQTISDLMLEDALAHPCRVDPKDYWGMLDAAHIRRFLGDRIVRMEAFAQTWDDPNNQVYKSITEPIAEKTYIFESDLAEADC
ncbi:MAG: hypothetical protein ACX94B_08965 [Henriciella sp.]|nr:hypothetical protein [Hyphomonadaceae bacterium]